MSNYDKCYFIVTLIVLIMNQGVLVLTTLLAKDCGVLAIPMNGSLEGSLTTFPNKISFGCDEGFILRGSKVRRCLSNGKWSGNKTFCEGKLSICWCVLINAGYRVL